MTQTSFAFTPPASVDAYSKRWKDALQSGRKVLGELEQGPSPDAVLAKFDQFDRLSEAQGCDAQLLRNVHSDKAMRDEAEVAEKEWAKLSAELQGSRKAYDALCTVDKKALDKKGKRLVEHMLRDYRREGVDKDEAFRERLRVLKDEITEINQVFDRNINADSRTIKIAAGKLKGLPQDFIDAHPAGPDGLVSISTNYPDLIPFLKYAEDESARRELTLTDRTRGEPANTEVLCKLFNKRKEMAEMLGYKTFADFKLEPAMVKNGKNVGDFIQRMKAMAAHRVKRDMEELAAIKGGKVELWDGQYLSAILKKEKYAFDGQAARQYFSFNAVRDGVLRATEKLFRVRFERIQTDTWHSDVEAYHLYDQDTLAGRFFLDLHPRDNKYKHAAEFPIRSGLPDQLPEASLICNFPRDNELMEHSEVVTFFHEFGHLLHHLFAQQKFAAIAGINCDFDFVEAPSQMLEQWAYDKATLQSFGKNAAGEVIPDDLLSALQASRAQGKGIFVGVQMSYADMSLQYHNGNAFNNLAELDEIYQKATTTYSPYPLNKEIHFEHSFGHLGGYSAGYYSYMWSEVIAKDLFTRFKADLYNEEVAREYKDKVLGQGGSLDSEECVKDFLGRPYSFDAFGEYLNED